eukprot:scaffold237181_cov34-Prasinocladus_malaysianus.AAC.2
MEWIKAVFLKYKFAMNYSKASVTGTKPSPSTVVTRYVRAAGILFTKTSLETLPAVAAAAAADLEVVLSSNAAKSRPMSGRQLLQLAAILIFSVHNANWVPEGHTPGYSEMVQRGVLLRGSLAAFFSFMAKLGKAVTTSSTEPSAEPQLATLRVGVLWLLGNPTYATPGSDPDQAEVASRAEFLRAMAGLVPGLPSTEGESLSLHLPEDSELRGFMPLAESHARLDFDAQPAASAMRPMYLRTSLVQLASLLPAHNSLRGSSRGLLSTKEWKSFEEAAQLFASSCQKPPVGPIATTGNGAQPQAGRKPAARCASAPDIRADVDPMEEDPLEFDDEEVILFKPKAITRGPSPSLPEKPLVSHPLAAVNPVASHAANTSVQETTAAQPGHHALWGSVGRTNGFQQLGFGMSHIQPESPAGSGNLADSMLDMGNSLVANLGLESPYQQQPQPQVQRSSFAGTGMISPPPSALPVSSGLLGSGSFFNFPPSAPLSDVNSNPASYNALQGKSSSLFGASPAPVAAPQAQTSSTLSGLGEGYGWLEALEAQQSR